MEVKLFLKMSTSKTRIPPVRTMPKLSKRPSNYYRKSAPTDDSPAMNAGKKKRGASARPLKTNHEHEIIEKFPKKDTE